jgi:hypothetical protein
MVVIAILSPKKTKILPLLLKFEEQFTLEDDLQLYWFFVRVFFDSEEGLERVFFCSFF